jgi:TFIIF-interacting CTD phosphatase-like protein
LEQASQHFELVCFTAGIEEYASVLMDKIDPDGKFFKHRLYRTHCVAVGGSFVKDLTVINRELSRCVLVDNNAFSFLFQLGNGIPVSR